MLLEKIKDLRELYLSHLIEIGNENKNQIGKLKNIAKTLCESIEKTTLTRKEMPDKLNDFLNHRYFGGSQLLTRLNNHFKKYGGKEDKSSFFGKWF